MVLDATDQRPQTPSGTGRGSATGHRAMLAGLTRGYAMSETDKAFTGAIPELYDRHLGPWLFEPYAADLAARIARRGARQVLEIAAGTGIVTRALRAALPAGVSIVATDL